MQITNSDFTPHSRNSLLATRNYFCRLSLAVLLGCLLLGHAPLVILHLRGLWQQEQYQYFPFVLAAFVWLLTSRWQAAPEIDSLPRWTAWPWLLLVCSLVLLASSIGLLSGWLAFVSLNIALAAVFVWLGRQRHITYLWGIWLLLWLMVPAPLGMDSRFVIFLQQLSSRLSSSLLDSVGILHVMAGNVLTFSDKQLFVDEACSGIVSVMSIVACTMIYAVWRNRSLVHLVGLAMLGVCGAILLNVVRICIIAAAHVHYDIDLSTGTSHEILGLILFVVMFLVLVSTDALLLSVLVPIAEDPVQKNWLIRVWNRAFSAREVVLESRVGRSVLDGKLPRTAPSPTIKGALFAGAFFLFLGTVQLVWLPSTDTAAARAAIGQALALQEDFAPATIGPWELESFEAVEREAYSDFGKYSRTYHYRHQQDGHRVTVALDFPYLGGWHDLSVCYRNAGWTIHDRLVQLPDRSSQEESWQYVESDLESSAGDMAQVLYAGFDVQGEPAIPPSALVLQRSWFRMRRRLLYHLAPRLFQVQVYYQGALSADKSMREELRELFYHMRELFRDSVGQEHLIDR